MIQWQSGVATPHVPHRYLMVRSLRTRLGSMKNAIDVGTVVRFEFTMHRVSLSDKVERKTGLGRVIDSADYSVWPVGYSLRVTESEDYAVGEVVHVTPQSVRRIEVR